MSNAADIAAAALLVLGGVGALLVLAQALRLRRPSEELLLTGAALALAGSWLAAPSPIWLMWCQLALLSSFAAGAFAHWFAMWPDHAWVPLVTIGLAVAGLVITLGM